MIVALGDDDTQEILLEPIICFDQQVIGDRRAIVHCRAEYNTITAIAPTKQDIAQAIYQDRLIDERL